MFRTKSYIPFTALFFFNLNYFYDYFNTRALAIVLEASASPLMNRAEQLGERQRRQDVAELVEQDDLYSQPRGNHVAFPQKTTIPGIC